MVSTINTIILVLPSESKFNEIELDENINKAERTKYYMIIG